MHKLHALHTCAVQTQTHGLPTTFLRTLMAGNRKFPNKIWEWGRGCPGAGRQNESHGDVHMYMTRRNDTHTHTVMYTSKHTCPHVFGFRYNKTT